MTPDAPAGPTAPSLPGGRRAVLYAVRRRGEADFGLMLAGSWANRRFEVRVDHCNS